MQRTIVYVLGTSYSGSSLLNSLFDAQPRTRGIGEAVHLLQRPTDAWCSGCKGHVDDCRLQKAIRPDQFYDSLFDACPENDVIVNSSKNWDLSFQCMPVPDPLYRIRVVVLSKSLEEFAQSFTVHEPCSFEAAFRTWLKVYRGIEGNLARVLNGHPESDTQRRLVGRIQANDITYVTYRELATQTDAAMRQLCERLTLPFDPAFRDRLWRGDDCVIGGNNAIYAQRTESPEFFASQSDYLNGKYVGRCGAVFYDDHWRRNTELLQAAAAFRSQQPDELHSLQRRLGQHPAPSELNEVSE